MLASTMQISNNNPTNPHTTNQHQDSRAKGGTRTTNPHPALTSQARHGLMLQDPTVCQTIPHHHDPTFHTHSEVDE